MTCKAWYVDYISDIFRDCKCGLRLCWSIGANARSTCTPFHPMSRREILYTIKCKYVFQLSELFLFNQTGKKKMKHTSTSSCDVRVECDPIINKVGVFNSSKGSSTP